MSKYTDCMSRELKGKMAGKTKAKRDAMFRAAAKKCSGGKAKKPSVKPKKKPRTRTIVIEGKRKMGNPKPRARAKGTQERKMLKHKKEFDDIARGLGIPSSKTKFKFVGKKWNLKIGSMKLIKRVKLSEAMKLVRKRAKSRV